MAFWKPGTIAPGSNIPVPKPSTLDRENEKESNALQLYNPNAGLSLHQQRIRLPIYPHRNEILYLVEKYSVVIIVGETGCGKTTQIPQYLHEAGWTQNGRVVACTQPRRVAATSVASRVAEEMGVQLGREVGYAIRFDECVDHNVTRLKYMTDGMLLRETMLDPLLSKYSVIMVDEAHERSLYTDILIGLLKKIQRKRRDLKLIISSATIDAEDVKEFFETNTTNDPSKDTVAIMSIEGRMFPVDIHFSIKPVADYMKATLETVMDIHKFQPEGDVLVFLTGQEEIDTMVQLLRDRSTEKMNLRMLVLPMYSGLTMDRQMSVFEPAPKRTRKIIVATNIAETSVTIDGIVYVVDCGFVKIRAYDPKLGVETLVVTPVSKATAKQRAGRAGRNRPGKCYRLYTEESYMKLRDAPVPEMQRTNLASVVLQLKALGIDDVLHFDFMSPPPVDNLIRALEILYSLGVLDSNAKLTEVGNIIAEFPVDPYLAKMLISAGKEYECSEEILSIAAVLSVQSVFNNNPEMRNQIDAQKRKFAVYEGDHLTLLNVYNAFIRHNKSAEWCHQHQVNYRSMLRAVEIRNQLRKYLKRWKIPIISCQGDAVKIRKCILSGYFANVAVLSPDGVYRTIRDQLELNIHPNSILYNRNPEWVVYHEVVQTAKLQMREVTTIDPLWLADIAPHFYEFKLRSAQHQQELENELKSSTTSTDSSRDAKRFRQLF